MDAVTVLRREHIRIAQLFEEIEALPPRACLGRRAIVEEIDQLVRRHIAVESAHAGRAQRLDDRALQLLDEIAAIDCRSPGYVTRLAVLRDELSRHIRETSYAEVA